MGGSGGSGGPYFNVSPEELKGRIKDATEEIAKVFSPKVQAFLDDKLRGYNSKDAELIEQRERAVLKNIGDFLDATWDLKLGGSVAKHTYVDGLSDVDNLLIINDATVEEQPKNILQALAQRLANALEDADVKIGKIALTVSYPDGMEIQFIPAVRDGEKIRVPSWTSEGWSHIDPGIYSCSDSAKSAV